MARADLADKVAVVTGASRGLGAGLAEHLAAAGLRLGLCARHEPAVPTGASEAVTTSVDVTDAAAVDAFAEDVVAALGRIDLWVNNAGVLDPIDPLRTADLAAFRLNLDVNVMGVVHGSRAMARHVRSRAGGGVLVNITSGAAQHGYAGWAAYCTSKAGVDRLTEVVAIEEAEAGLRAHAVAPGVIDTDMQAAIRATPAERFPAVERFRQLKAADAFTTPDVVADYLLDLAFDPAARTDEVVLRIPSPR